jgi:hypothetical protein
MNVIGRFGEGFVRSAALLCLLSTLCYAVVDRLVVFDNANNQLLFVKFLYDGTGKNIGRDVFTADSTFLRHTTFQSNAQGQITKETSTDFDSNMVFYTNLSTSGNASTFSVFDQFNVDQLGGAISTATSDQVSYDVTQGGAVINKIKYTLSGAAVKQIDVYDNAGARLYYAMVYQTPLSQNPDLRPQVAVRPSVTSLGSGRFKVTCTLPQASTVTLELFDLSGRRSALALNKRYGAGMHAIAVDAAGGHGDAKVIGDGAYIVLLSIDGKQAVKIVSILQK